jgi:hypothetical protein
MEGLCFLCLTEMCNHEKGERDYRHQPTSADTPRAVTLVQGTALCASCAIGKAREMLLLLLTRGMP